MRAAGRVSNTFDGPMEKECHCIAGEDCILAKVRTKDAQDLNRLLQEIKNLPGVQGTLTTVVLSTLFERGIQP